MMCDSHDFQGYLKGLVMAGITEIRVLGSGFNSKVYGIPRELYCQGCHLLSLSTGCWAKVDGGDGQYKLRPEILEFLRKPLAPRVEPKVEAHFSFDDPALARGWIPEEQMLLIKKISPHGEL